MMCRVIVKHKCTQENSFDRSIFPYIHIYNSEEKSVFIFYGDLYGREM